MLILLLAANTAYTGLPNLLSILAQDGFIPRQFKHRGAKLTFSNGIILIFVCAAALIVIFSADVHHLIPLYSVGVFVSFTISQAGMVKKWRKDHHEKGAVRSMIINGIGTVMTFCALIIVFVMKFTHGAWVLAIVIPGFAILMHFVSRHYEKVTEHIAVTKEAFREHYRPSRSQNNFLAIVLINEVTKPSLKLLNFANQMTSNVRAIHIATDDETAREVVSAWDDYTEGLGIDIQVLPSPTRDIVGTLQDYLDEREKELRPGSGIAVVLTKLVLEHRYESLLHNQTTFFITRCLRGYRDVATVQVPYHYHLHAKRFAAGGTGDVFRSATGQMPAVTGAATATATKTKQATGKMRKVKPTAPNPLLDDTDEDTSTLLETEEEYERHKQQTEAFERINSE
jgi:hypothetical protein